MSVRAWLLMALLCGFIAAAFTTSCSAMTTADDPATTLYEAKDLTPGTRSLIAAVVSDIRSRQYRYTPDARREALDAIRRLQAIEFLVDVRAIAAMPISSEDEQGYPDLIAVAGALTVLTDLDDTAARELNRARLNDESVRGFAILNLKQLLDWEATAAVEAELNVMKMVSANTGEVVAMLNFLLESPNTTGEICAGLDRIGKAYPECAPGSSTSRHYFCVDLVSLTIELRGKKCKREVTSPDHRSSQTRTCPDGGVRP
jgi:hypothetical protein